MLINEIFDSHAKVSWNETDSGHRGHFTLDDYQYAIHVDEYEFKFETSKKQYHFVDAGFTSLDTNGKETWTATNFNKNQGKILGTVINNTEEKIRKLDPDALIFGVNFKNGDNEKRMSLYRRIAKMYTRTVFDFSHEIKTANGQYILVSKQNISDEDYKDIQKFIDQHVKLK